MIKPGTEALNIKEAARTLESGGLVAFATETVYGLGASALEPAALEKIFLKKNRPTTDPLILHIYDKSQLLDLVKEVTPVAEKLIENFWPGPLTLILPKRPEVPDLATAGLSTVAVRMPNHPVALALLKEFGRPIAAPSANKFQSISPTTAKAVEAELGEDLMILDGGPCEKGLESTVLSLVGKPTVLRFGSITLEQLSEVLEEPPAIGVKGGAESMPQVSPGLLDFHYAPKTPLRFFEKDGDLAQIPASERPTLYLIVYSKTERDFAVKLGFARIKMLSPEGRLEIAAQSLYSSLREIDQQRPRLIGALKVPDRGLGKAINDRLRKAAHEKRH